MKRATKQVWKRTHSDIMPLKKSIVVRFEYADGGQRLPFVVETPKLKRLAGPFDTQGEAETWIADNIRV